MKKVLPTLLSLVLLSHSLPAQAVDAPLPALATIIQRGLDRAAKEDENDREFNQIYTYTRVRETDWHNSKGELTSSEKKSTTEGAGKVKSKPATAPRPVEKGEPVSETHSNIHGKALQVKDYSLSNLVSRFEFTLAGRETVNGRSALVLDFQPAGKNLPVNSYKDNFINKAAGRIWVDEQDYAIAKADVHLTKEVKVMGGLLGAVWKFTYSFDRERTPEGLWVARHVDWHLEGREVVFDRIVDYHEQKFGEQKAPPVSTAVR